jgi:apolipoprotein N-acyltransferase
VLKAIGRFVLPADVSVRKRRLELIVWAFLLSLSFYPGWFGFLAWLSLARPVMIISDLDSRSAFRSAYWFSFFFNLFAIYWVAMVTPPGMLAAVAIVAFYYTAAFMLFHRVYTWKPIYGFAAFPFLWVGIEYFRTLSQFAFPWADLGYSQAYYLWVLQIVSVISVHGLSFLLILVNMLLLLVMRKSLLPERRLTALLAAIAVTGLTVAYGFIVTPPIPRDGQFKIALLQGSVPLDVKWSRESRDRNFVLYDSLSQSLADSGTGLMVWPETSAPCYLTTDNGCQNRVGEIAARSGTFQLVGALGIGWADNYRRSYNSCFQFGPDGHMGMQYDKTKLVPFAEAVPYQDQLPFLRAEFLEKYLTFIKTYDVQWWSDFYPGDSVHLFEVPGARYGVLICFECTFPEYVRQMVLDGAEFLVGITNDTWFGNSVGIHMHARIFITRAVENRMWMARTANSGLTFIVDKYGRIRDQLEFNEVAALTGKVGFLDEYSTFTRYGDIAGRVSLLILTLIVAILFLSWLTRKFTKRS